MIETWIFKPKYGKDIFNKVIEGFVDHFLDWYNQGVAFEIEELKDGWFELTARIEEPSRTEFFTEVCYTDMPIDGRMLTDYMMVILVEAGVAYLSGYQDDSGHNEHILEDVEITQVLAALSEDGTSIFSPTGSQCYVFPVGDDGRKAKMVSMLDVILTLEIA